MECSNCTFQNTPGTRVCVRCRSLVDFSDVNVIPPRARDGRMQRRVRSAAATARFGLRDWAASFGNAVRIPADLQMRWTDLALCLVPGMAQIHRRERAVGWTILGTWLFLLMVAAINFATPWATFYSFAALSVHSLAVSLVTAKPLQRVGVVTRLAIGLGIYLGLLFLLYRPALQLGRNFVSILPVDGVRSKEPFTNGDVLLYTGRWSRPTAWERGDLVVIEIPGSQQGAVIIRPGYCVDRIVGLPGDHVCMDGHELSVNDEPQPEELCPVMGAKGLPPLDLTAGPGEYIVLPTSLRWQGHGNTVPLMQALLRTVAKVDDSRLLGRVFWRARPWSKVGPM
jgi:hypothetical protein